MIRATTKISTLVLICLLLGVGSCSRVDDFQSGGKLLEVNVQMASSSPMPTPMLTRGATASPIISDTVDMGNDLVMVATSQPRQTEEALTRGTPIKSAANLPSMNVKVYNSGAAAFSGSTALKTTLKGTNSSGSWSLSPAYVLKDGEKNTYMAYSPIESGSNGITVAADGRTLTYTAPATVANHPDLCSATIIKDDVSGYLPLAMQHRLVAVGIKGMGNWVKINSIVLSNVYSSGTLNLETGAWSNLGTKTNFTPVTTQSSLSTNGAMNDITAANGYLMLPPQSFTDDNQTITVKYQYLNDGGFPEQTATYRLKELTGGKWDAGQIVMYEIQLNSYFSLTLNPASLTLGAIAGTASFTYSTNNPSANATKFDNNGNTWITNIQVNRSTKTVTFNYAATTTEGNRSAVVRGTSGFTTTDIGLSQSLNFSISPASGGNIAAAGGSPTVNVTASDKVAWSVTGSNCTASPNSSTGTGGAQAVTLPIGLNPSFTTTRPISATFKVTSSPSIAKTWSATQEKSIFSISPTSSANIAGAGGSVTVNVTATKGVVWNVTGTNCTASPASFTSTGAVQAVKLTIPVNSSAGTRNIVAEFKVTSPTSTTQKWSATQDKGAPADCYPTPLAGFTDLYVAKTDNYYVANYQNSQNDCDAWGGRLPYVAELRAMYNNRALYGCRADWYWSLTTSNNGYSATAINFADGIQNNKPISENRYARCVKKG